MLVLHGRLNYTVTCTVSYVSSSVSFTDPPPPTQIPIDRNDDVDQQKVFDAALEMDTKYVFKILMAILPK